MHNQRNIHCALTVLSREQLRHRTQRERQETVIKDLTQAPWTPGVTEISYHIWSGDYTRTFYTPHR